jgi:geranylgeranyl diphosphate synthase, type I
VSGCVAAVYPIQDRAVSAVGITAAIEAMLDRFLGEHTRQLAGMSPDLSMLADAAHSAMRGGKRLRPVFTYWGWRSVLPAGAPGEDSILAAAAAVELLHGCALAQDDVMDSSDTRRGRPATHVGFADVHAASGRQGSSAAFGRSAAVLLGDLLLSWAGELFANATESLQPQRRVAARAEFDRMRTEMVAGQFLDVLGQEQGCFRTSDALRVAEFKTSRYSVLRPVLIGALAAGSSESGIRALSGFGSALGDAFQLRDDLLGVFGDPASTGKPAGLDIIEGKQTVLMALAIERASERQRAELTAQLNNHDLHAGGLSRVRQLLIQTGARDDVERLIDEAVTRAHRALSQPEGPARPLIRPDAMTALLELADLAAHRAR